MTATESELYEVLDRLGIGHETFRHDPVYTVSESQALRGKLAGGHAKNLFLKTRNGQYLLAVLEENQSVDIRGLGTVTGMGRLSFASPERLMARLGVVPGSVTPFALLNAVGATDIRVVIDQVLLAEEYVSFHPLQNAATTTIRSADLLRFMEHCGFRPEILDFTAI